MTGHLGCCVLGRYLADLSFYLSPVAHCASGVFLEPKSARPLQPLVCAAAAFCVFATQPIEWKAPDGARVIDLMPLSRAETERFLLSRPVGADERQRVHAEAYAKAVEDFLHRALDEAPSEGERQAAELVLSNPFDLTFAADLLAQGLKPSAVALIDEAFRLADEGATGESGYREVAGQPFPLVRFGRLAVAMRLEDRNWPCHVGGGLAVTDL